MPRLQRSCYRLVWLNPLAGAPGYQPLAAGMQAADPYIDDFLSAGNGASLARPLRVSLRGSRRSNGLAGSWPGARRVEHPASPIVGRAGPTSRGPESRSIHTATVA